MHFVQEQLKMIIFWHRKTNEKKRTTKLADCKKTAAIALKICSLKQNSKKRQTKKLLFSLKDEMLYFDKESVEVIAASINCSQITFI